MRIFDNHNSVWDASCDGMQTPAIMVLNCVATHEMLCTVLKKSALARTKSIDLIRSLGFRPVAPFTNTDWFLI